MKSCHDLPAVIGCDGVVVGNGMVSVAAQFAGKWRWHGRSTHSFLEL